MFSFRRRSQKKQDRGGPPYIRASPSLPELSSQGIPWPEDLIDAAEIPKAAAPPLPAQGASCTDQNRWRCAQRAGMVQHYQRSPPAGLYPLCTLHTHHPHLTTANPRIVRVIDRASGGIASRRPSTSWCVAPLSFISYGPERGHLPGRGCPRYRKDVSAASHSRDSRDLAHRHSRTASRPRRVSARCTAAYRRDTQHTRGDMRVEARPAHAFSY